jgi:hypothetical protein
MLVFGLEPITASVFAAEVDDRKCKYHYGSAFAASIGWVPRQNNMGGENNMLASASAVTEHPTPARAMRPAYVFHVHAAAPFCF